MTGGWSAGSIGDWFLRKSLTALSALLLAATGVSASTPPLPPELEPIPVSMLVDLGSGQVLHARQPDLPFVPASVTKVMTAYVAFEQIKRGTLKPEQEYTVSEAVARDWTGKGTSLYLKAGDKVSVDLLIRGVTTVSANDGAAVLAEGFAGSLPTWAQMMNAEARRLGMSNSHFNTPNGWMDEGATYVSARDLVRLADAMTLRHPDLYRRYIGHKTLLWANGGARNHDPLIGKFPGSDGIKTGYTREAGYNYLGSAERNGRRLAMVIAGARNGPERAAAAKALMEWGFSAWNVRPLFGAGAKVGEALVQDGTARQVALVSPRSIHAALPFSGGGVTALRIVYKGPLVAPIKKGDKVAELEIQTSAGEPGRVPLFAADSVGRAGMWDRLVNGLVAFSQ
jgi:serine-type D-Ala-D-Ala carboxypeptidase (penicillin-binding protein 5/6)